jgi:hypothetical protein
MQTKISIESLLHLGNPTEEQQNILSYMLTKGYKSVTTLPNGTRKYSSK